MRLERDTSIAARNVSVRCVGKYHETNGGAHTPGGRSRPGRMVLLADTYFDLDGRAFLDYYCLACVAHGNGAPKREE